MMAVQALPHPQEEEGAEEGEDPEQSGDSEDLVGGLTHACIIQL
jgi:hypothetical protein